LTRSSPAKAPPPPPGSPSGGAICRGSRERPTPPGVFLGIFLTAVPAGARLVLVFSDNGPTALVGTVDPFGLAARSRKVTAASRPGPGRSRTPAGGVDRQAAPEIIDRQVHTVWWRLLDAGALHSSVFCVSQPLIQFLRERFPRGILARRLFGRGRRSFSEFMGTTALGFRISHREPWEARQSASSSRTDLDGENSRANPRSFGEYLSEISNPLRRFPADLTPRCYRLFANVGGFPEFRTAGRSRHGLGGNNMSETSDDGRLWQESARS